MTKPDYHAPVEAPPKTPLALQAAQFAFWAPIVSILLNLVVGYVFTAANSTSSGSVRQALGWLVLSLNGAALIAAVVALLGIRKLGARGILWRSLIGLAMSGLILGNAVYVAYFFRPGDRIVQRLVGEWESAPRMEAGRKTKSHLSLQQDRTANVQLTVNDQTLNLKGQWGIRWTATQPATLAVKWDAGTDPRMGEGVIWILDSLNDNQMSLVGTKNDAPSREIYQRQQK